MSEKKIEDIALDFLICCYFGQSEDLGKAAVDRAYVDMAAHTLKFDGTYEEKWKCRFESSEMIIKGLKEFNGGKPFDEWYVEIINKMKGIYNYKVKIDDRVATLSDGQARKWLNMTIKYLFVFKVLLGDCNRLEGFSEFFKQSSEKDYNIPIDSYVLKHFNIKGTWSKLDAEDYENVMKELTKELDKGNPFLWELENWEIVSSEDKSVNSDKESYKYYYDKQKKDV